MDDVDDVDDVNDADDADDVDDVDDVDVANVAEDAKDANKDGTHEDRLLAAGRRAARRQAASPSPDERTPMKKPATAILTRPVSAVPARPMTALLAVLAVLGVALAFALVTPPALAGPYGDALGKCLVGASTSAEKTVLVRWMFAMMSLHPDVQSAAAMTPEQRTEVSKQTAKLFERLLTQACATEAADAVRYEGASTIESSFNLLGQVAARELFSHPNVSGGLSEFAQYLDQKRLTELLQAKPAAAEPGAPR